MSNQTNNVPDRSPAIRLYYAIQHEYLESTRYSLGKVLTIIDACISDQEQRKGIKNLIQQAHYSEEKKRLSEIKFLCHQFFSRFNDKMLIGHEDEKEFWEYNKPKITTNHFPNN